LGQKEVEGMKRRKERGIEFSEGLTIIIYWLMILLTLVVLHYIGWIG